MQVVLILFHIHPELNHNLLFRLNSMEKVRLQLEKITIYFPPTGYTKAHAIK